MTTKNYQTRFTVEASADAAFAAIINPRSWWSGEFEGDSLALGHEFTYRYRDFHFSRQKVTEFVPGKRLAWLVTEGTLSFVEDKSEWVGTTITFDIEPHGTECEVIFTHVGLSPSVECFDTCSDAWSALVQGSLKRVIATGRSEQIDLAAP